MSTPERRQYVFDTLTKHDPATEAGRALDLLWRTTSGMDRLEWRERILAIEEHAARQGAVAGLDEAARQFIEDHDGDAHSDATWPCDGQCVQARALRLAARQPVEP